jgi:MYXO-CTERM domain-containing protein
MGSAGSTGIAPAEDGGAATTLPVVTCETLSTSHCELNVVHCTAASDCPSQWSCVAPPDTAVGCSAGASEDGGTTIPDCTPIPTNVQNQCEPPYYNYGSSSAGYDEGTSAPVSAPNGKGADGPEQSAAKGPGPATSAGGGCQMGSGPADLGAGLWAGLFGIAALLRRRRSA